ncbi:MAG: YiiD C-terminal domain-containing protein [Motiliproteus sp.]
MTASKQQRNSAASLEAVLHQSIPASEILQLQVTELSDRFITIKAPVEGPNINIHGTGFAGSIYVVCALSAWGLTYNRLDLEDIDVDLVIAKAEISYMRPITGEIEARCSVDDSLYQKFISEIEQKGRASIEAQVEAISGDTVKARLKARLVAIKRSCN